MLLKKKYLPYSFIEWLFTIEIEHNPLDVDMVLIDEYQDTSSLENKFVKSVKEDTTLIVVEDPLQNIFTWRGSTLDNIFNFVGKRFNISETFRCPKPVVAILNRIVDKIKMVDSENADKLNYLRSSKEGPEPTIIDCEEEMVPDLIREVLGNTIGEYNEEDTFILSRKNKQVLEIKKAISMDFKVIPYDHTIWRNDLMIDFILLCKCFANSWKFQSVQTFLKAIGKTKELDKKIISDDLYEKELMDIVKKYKDLFDREEDLYVVANRMFSTYVNPIMREHVDPVLYALEIYGVRYGKNPFHFLEYIMDTVKIFKGIHVQTCHNSKGREADLVILNMHGMITGRGCLAEEYRVLFVAISRTKQKLVILKPEGMYL